MTMVRTTEKVRSVMNRLVDEIRTEMVRRGNKATGELSQSTRITVLSGNTYVIAEGHALSHWKYAGNGRGPGKQPPVKALRPWLRAKGLPEGLAYPIAKKIGKEGSKDFQLKNENIYSGRIRVFQEQGRFYLGKEAHADIKELVLEDFTKLKKAA